MTRRYEIQDILAQDARGVIFHAFDNQAEVDVVLRRFFPFGPEGGGLAGQDREVYVAAVEHLKAVEHPALRKVLDGGCDPVDGMPFLVTEWVEGQRLASFLAEGNLNPESARAVLYYALEASKVLAGALGGQGVWVETAPESIILSEGEGGRGVTFWICPLRWLGSSGAASKGLLPLAELAEEMMGWRGKAIGDAAGEGLGAWVKAIRQSPRGWTLEQAEAALAPQAAVAMKSVPAPRTATAAPRAAGQEATAGSRPPVAEMSKASVWPKVLIAFLVVVVSGLGVWVAKGGRLVLQRSPGGEGGPKVAVMSESEEPAKPEERKGGEVLAYGGGGAGQAGSGGGGPAAPDAQRTPQEAVPKTYVEEAAERAAAKPSGGQEVAGEIVQVEESKGGVTRYFKLKVGSEFRWAGHPNRVSAPGLSLAEMKQMIGKKVRVTGQLRSESSYRREVVIFESKDQVSELPP